MRIDSETNSKIKYWKNLKQKKYRDLENKFLVYGEHLITEALKSNQVETIISTDESLEADFYINHKLAKMLCDLPSIPKRMAVVYKNNVKTISSNKVLVLDKVQDPDNLGALLRSALAFGFNDVLLSLDSVDLYNDKVVRASQGALFSLNITSDNLVIKLEELKKAGYLLVGASNKNSPKKKDTLKLALILGNEGQGISLEVEKLIDIFDTIKTNKVESLNVSVAGAILMYEWGKIL